MAEADTLGLPFGHEQLLEGDVFDPYLAVAEENLNRNVGFRF